MSNGAKIAMSLGGIIVLSTLGYIGYVKWTLPPSLVSKSGKTMTLKYRGKNMVVNVDELSKTGTAQNLSGKWNLVPSYSNQADKSTLNGLVVMDRNNVIHRTYYF